MKSSSCQDTRLPSPLPTAVHTQLGQSHHQRHKLGPFSHMQDGNIVLRHGRREQRGTPLERPQPGRVCQPCPVYKWIQEASLLHSAPHQRSEEPWAGP